MDVEEIRAARLAHPFKPFNLVLDDGRELLVDKSYYLGISPTKRFVVHASLDGFYETIAVGRVRAIDYLPDADNGRRESPGPSPTEGAA
jgi:hypothetical protein